MIEDGVVLFHENSLNWPPTFKCGLLNLAQLCRRNHKKDWKQIVFHHFDGLWETHKHSTEFEGQIANFYLAYNLLAVRLWPDRHMQTIGEEKCIVRRDLDGVVSTLVFDLPSTIRQVRPEDADHWNKSAEELFKIGLANVRKMPRPEISEIDAGNGVKVILFAGDSFYVSTYALLLKYYPACIGPYGVLISVPTRHAMLCYPIRDIEVVKVVHTLIFVTNGMYHDGPGAISPNLYWYHDDKFTLFPYEIEDKRLAIKPPDAFVSLLGSFSQDGV
ncbi:MAG: hypothetical protein JXB07_13365 [Anaerolineae bacterium]|nr:hypothetical protein [Anaerolineae bacterium]